VKIWDALSHQEVATLAGHNHEVTSVEFFKSHSNFIVTGSSDKTIRVWNVQDKSLVWTYYCDAGTIAVDTTEDDLILVGDSAGCVHVLSPTGLFY
jgi:WD40 repeat protein